MSRYTRTVIPAIFGAALLSGMYQGNTRQTQEIARTNEVLLTIGESEGLQHLMKQAGGQEALLTDACREQRPTGLAQSVIEYTCMLLQDERLKEKVDEVQRQCALPDRMHVYSRMFLAQYVRDPSLAQGFSQAFHLPDSTLLQYTPCIVELVSKTRTQESTQ